MALRLPAAHHPYHQDEYKWVLYSHPEIIPPGTVPHTPLTEFIYAKTLGPALGDNNFRFIPIGFSLINLFLIFYLVKFLFDNQFDKLIARKAAFWASFLFAISFYSVLASTMVDVDGTVMPFFFLLTSIGYFKLRKHNFQLSDGRWKWLTLIGISVIGGFLIKVVFAITVLPFIIDYAIEKNIFSDKKKMLKYLLYLFGGAIALVLILLGIKLIFPFFNLSKSFEYWKHFVVFEGRGWLQTFIQFVKAVMYTSPLLVMPLFFTDREIFKKIRPFFIFIFTSSFFYLFAFDFSLGALDRYFQFLVVPLAIISGVIFAKVFNGFDFKRARKEFIFPIILSIVVFLFQFLNHFVPPHYPKTEWIKRIVSLKWNFLFPFSGGSGPIGFYVSFLFIVLIWILSIIFVIFALRKKNIRKGALTAILILGILYNGVFIEEYLFGGINGSSPKLVKESVEFIRNSPEVKKVIVYNDNGGWNVRETGKYERRMYAVPQFEDEYKKVLNNFNGHILFIDIPRINPDSFYVEYMNSCKVVYKKVDKRISSKIYDCRKKI